MKLPIITTVDTYRVQAGDVGFQVEASHAIGEEPSYTVGHVPSLGDIDTSAGFLRVSGRAPIRIAALTLGEMRALSDLLQEVLRDAAVQ